MATEVRTTPGTLNYIHKRGDTWEPDPITAYDGGEIVGGVLVGGTPRNFTNYTGRMQIKTGLSGDVIQTLSTGGNGITLSSAGVITLTMTPAQTAAIQPGEYKYDLQTTSPSGAIKTWVEGTFNIVPDITANS